MRGVAVGGSICFAYCGTVQHRVKGDGREDGIFKQEGGDE